MKRLMNGFLVEMTPRQSGFYFHCLHVQFQSQICSLWHMYDVKVIIWIFQKIFLIFKSQENVVLFKVICWLN